MENIITLIRFFFNNYFKGNYLPCVFYSNKKVTRSEKYKKSKKYIYNFISANEKISCFFFLFYMCVLKRKTKPMNN